MKTLKCDQCEVTVQTETFGEWMKTLMPHYIEAHADFMKAKGDKSDEEQKAEQGRWMSDNKKRFEEA